jgi:hypothetical protein
LYLEGKYDHENSLFSVGEDVLDECPPRPDEDDGKEKQSALQQVGDVVEDRPAKKNNLKNIKRRTKNEIIIS